MKHIPTLLTRLGRSWLVLALWAGFGCSSNRLVECRELMVLVTRTSGRAFAAFDSKDKAKAELTTAANDVEKLQLETGRAGSSGALDLTAFRDAYAVNLRQIAAEVADDSVSAQKHLVQKTAETVESISVRCSGER